MTWWYLDLWALSPVSRRWELIDKQMQYGDAAMAQGLGMGMARQSFDINMRGGQSLVRCYRWTGAAWELCPLQDGGL